MPIEIYQTGKDNGLKGVGDLPWSAYLGTVMVGPKTAEKMVKAIADETAAGTVLELRKKGEKIEGTEIRREKTFFKIEGKASDVSASAALAAKEPPHDRESVRRAGAKAAKNASEGKAKKGLSIRSKVEKNDGPKGYKSVKVAIDDPEKKAEKKGTPKKKATGPINPQRHHYPVKGRKGVPQLAVVEGGKSTEAVRSVPVAGTN